MNPVCFAKIQRYDAVRQHPSHENPLVTIASYRATPETRAVFARSFIVPECAGPRTVYHRVHPFRNDVRILLREADPGMMIHSCITIPSRRVGEPTFRNMHGSKPRPWIQNERKLPLPRNFPSVPFFVRLVPDLLLTLRFLFRLYWSLLSWRLRILSHMGSLGGRIIRLLVNWYPS